MAGTATSRDVSAKEALEDIRGPLSNGELMEKYKITPAGYADLLKQLYVKRLITEDDLTRRGIRFRIVKPVEERPVERVPVIPPQPMYDDEDEEFLDTVTLTELLAFKPQEPPPRKEKEESPPPAEKEDTSSKDKKSKFSLTGLFKKSS